MYKSILKKRESRTKGETFKALSLSALSLFFFLFLISFTSASSFGYDYLEHTAEGVTAGSNYSINVNNSDYLQGYTPLTLRTFFELTINNLANYYSKTDINNFNASYLNTTNMSYVPYTGANQNVNLGNNNLTVNGTTIINGNLGTERVPNLTGSSGDVGGWTLSNITGYVQPFANSISKTGDGTGTITPTDATNIIAGRIYKVVIVVSSLSGGLVFVNLGGTTINTLSEAKTYTFYARTADTSKLSLNPYLTALRMDITSISIKEVNADTGNLEVEGNLILKNTVKTPDGVDIFRILPSGGVIIIGKNLVGGVGFTTELNSIAGGQYGLRTNGPIKANNFYLANVNEGFYTYGGVAMFYANSVGNFGIGTTNPLSNIHMNGSVLANGTINATSGGSFGGNVGIGTTSPLSLLHINGSILANGTINATGDGKIGGNLNITGNLSVKRPYGMFSSTESQNITSANTPFAISFNWTEDSYQINKQDSNTNFSFQDSGDYLIELSAIVTTLSNNKHIQIWVQKNGINVPRSNTRVEIENAGTDQVIAVPFILDANAITDKFRFMMASDDLGTLLIYTTNTSYSPESPSVIVTMTKISEITD